MEVEVIAWRPPTHIGWDQLGWLPRLATNQNIDTKAQQEQEQEQEQQEKEQEQGTNKNCSPLQHILFLCFYKGVDTKSAALSLFTRKQPANKYFYQWYYTSEIVVVVVVVVVGVVGGGAAVAVAVAVAAAAAAVVTGRLSRCKTST